MDKIEDDQYAYRQKINPYYPFQDKGEWELGNSVLEVEMFDDPNHAKPLFTMKDHLLNWVDSLPSFVPWKVSKSEFKGYKTVHPVELVWCDVLDVVKQLFSDPTFANHMTFHPHVANIKNQHEYGDYMSADMAWKIQDHLPLGATQVPIILGSDKTPVMQLAGGIKMHPVFITISNIDSEPTFPSSSFAFIQNTNLFFKPDWHKCMDLVCANLKVATEDGCFMLDLSHYIQHVFMPFIAHVCDLLEATMIAAVSKNASPLTMATQEKFGDGILHPPHIGKYTLQLIVEISRQVDLWDLDKFQKVAKDVNLSGVHMPYWGDWMFACPSVFLSGKVLYTCHNFFADHPLKWIKEIVGEYKLDTHFIVQHKRVGTRHFTKGITHVNQMTGYEHRDIQRTIVASIAGAVPPRFLRAICVLVDFFYLAQNPVHSPPSLQSMVHMLLDFHTFKDTVICYSHIT
ncbi:hypothetical protein BDR07DRAFT_1482871 [Suillus spraguei]|nr:hypothetical protein BDR07DRAFT_1482871 [Suillus spraguei]